MISRLKQGMRAIFAVAHPIDDEAVAAILSPPQLALFKRMRRVEQLHSLRVMHALAAQGHDNPDLLCAALLHDCGKSRYRFTLVERVLVVLVKRLLPAAYARWSMAKPEGWRRMFVISAQHPQWSAEDMERAGAPALAVALACRHQHRVQGVPTCDEDLLLVALQAADDDN